MLIIIVLLFLVCWGPHLFWNILIKIGLNSYSGDMYSLNLTFKLLPFIHSCMNPIIYSLMSSNFRRIMMRLCSNQSCGNEPSFCCQKSSTTTRLRYRSTTYELGMNGESRRGHSKLHHTYSNTCSSDARTSPITECESMIHDVTSFA